MIFIFLYVALIPALSLSKNKFIVFPFKSSKWDFVKLVPINAIAFLTSIRYNATTSNCPSTRYTSFVSLIYCLAL